MHVSLHGVKAPPKVGAAGINPVGVTSLLVAAVREWHTSLPAEQRLFSDPFAGVFAGDLGRGALQQFLGAVGKDKYPPFLEVRTRWIDDGLAADAKGGIRQVLLLAAGMDSRAYRLGLSSTKFVEVDQPEVLAYKRAQLQKHFRRTPLATSQPANLKEDWVPTVSKAKGFNPAAPTSIVIEGLSHYLTDDAVRTLLDKVGQFAARGSTVRLDVVGQSFFQAPATQMVQAVMKKAGSEWTFGTDTPTDFLPASFRKSATVMEAQTLGTKLGGWVIPGTSTPAPEVPGMYFLTATKQ